MKGTKIYTQKNGPVTGSLPSDKWKFAVKFVNIVTGIAHDCDDMVYTTERMAIADHTETQNNYFLERKRRINRELTYEKIAAVAVVEQLNDLIKQITETRLEAINAAEVELRKATLNLTVLNH